MNFFAAHGGIIGGTFLIFLLIFFPRLSMIGMLIWGKLTGGGFLWWLGFLIWPLAVVFNEAMTNYVDTNPLLCAFAFLAALAVPLNMFLSSKEIK